VQSPDPALVQLNDVNLYFTSLFIFPGDDLAVVVLCA
jgi:hypothetical protein